jgi:hypothetical protein
LTTSGVTDTAIQQSIAEYDTGSANQVASVGGRSAGDIGSGMREVEK